MFGGLGDYVSGFRGFGEFFSIFSIFFDFFGNFRVWGWFLSFKIIQIKQCGDEEEMCVFLRVLFPFFDSFFDNKNSNQNDNNANKLVRFRYKQMSSVMYKVN